MIMDHRHMGARDQRPKSLTPVCVWTASTVHCFIYNYPVNLTYTIITISTVLLFQDGCSKFTIQIRKLWQDSKFSFNPDAISLLELFYSINKIRSFIFKDRTTTLRKIPGYPDICKNTRNRLCEIPDNHRQTTTGCSGQTPKPIGPGTMEADRLEWTTRDYHHVSRQELRLRHLYIGRLE